MILGDRAQHQSGLDLLADPDRQLGAVRQAEDGRAAAARAGPHAEQAQLLAARMGELGQTAAFARMEKGIEPRQDAGVRCGRGISRLRSGIGRHEQHHQPHKLDQDQGRNRQLNPRRRRAPRGRTASADRPVRRTGQPDGQT